MKYVEGAIIANEYLSRMFHVRRIRFAGAQHDIDWISTA